MARIDNLDNFLTDIATAIRTKTEKTEQIPAEQFDQEILNIETGVDTSDATATANDIVQGATAYVNGEKIEGSLTFASTLDNRNEDETVKNQPFTQVYNFNGETYFDMNVEASRMRGDMEYVDRAALDLNDSGGHNLVIAIGDKASNVANAIGLTADKLTKGSTVLGIEGTAEAGSSDVPVKLFETMEEMNADLTAQEGDLAVVYREEIQNATADSRFSSATFPATVVLPQAITDYVEVRYRAVDDSVMFDCWGNLDANRFSMDCYTESGSIRITYESSDGITYTRTDDGEEIIDFGTEIYYYDSDYWNDAIGCFIQAGGSIFEGLHAYSKLKDGKYILLHTTTGRTLKMPNVTLFGDNWVQMNRDIVVIVVGETDESNRILSGTAYTDYPFNEYNVAVDSGNLTTSRAVAQGFGYGYVFTCDYENNQILVPDGNFGGGLLPYDAETEYATNCNIYTDTTYTSTIFESTYDYEYAYAYAATQLTLNNANQLLPGKIAYGKNGVITGDGSVYTQISNFDLFQSQGMDILNNYTVLATNAAVNKLGEVNTLGTIACEYKKFDKPEELAEYDIHRIQNNTKYLAMKGGLEYRLYDLDFNLLDTLTFTEKQTIATLDSFMLNTSDLLLYQTTGTTTTHYRWIRITDTFEKIDYSIIGGTSPHIFAYHVFNDVLYLAFDNGGSYMYVYKLTTSGAASQLYKTSKAINYTYQGFANFCEYEGALYCSLVCNYGSTAYANDVVKITSSGSATAVYSGAYNEPMVVTVNGYAVSKNGTYRVTDFTTAVSTASRTYSYYSNYTPYYDEAHDAIIDYDYLYIGISGSTFRRDETLRTVITNAASGTASSLITDISNYETATILNIPMEDGTKLSFDMTVYLNKGESDEGCKLIDLLNLDTSGRKNLYLGCISTLQKQYDDTITPAEYNAAIDTANQILGEEVQ